MSNPTLSAPLYHSQQYQSAKKKLPDYYIYLFPSRKFIQQNQVQSVVGLKLNIPFVSFPFLLQLKLYCSFHGRLFYIAILSLVFTNKNTENNTNTIMSSNTMNLTACDRHSFSLPQSKFHLLVQKSTGTCDILH